MVSDSGREQQTMVQIVHLQWEYFNLFYNKKWI